MPPAVLEPESKAEPKPKPEPKVQQSKSDQKPKRDASQKYISHFARKVSNWRPPYLTHEDEAGAGITIVTLDLRSGNAPDSGPRFIEPASRDEIKKFVELYRPWERYDLEPIRGDEMDDPKKMKGKPWEKSGKFHVAVFMLSALTTFARPYEPKTPVESDEPELSDEPEEPIPRIWYNDAWRKMSGWLDSSWNKYCSICPMDDSSWNVQFLMVPKDASKPHVNAFMVSGEPLRDDALSTGEVAVATGLITIRRCHQKYKEHRYIPITIFSMSHRQICVVQAWHDREKPRALHVRRSPIMEFLEGAKGNWEDWITILCYMMGDSVLDDGGCQVGKTEKDG